MKRGKAEKLVDAHAKAVINYNSGKSFKFGELSKARETLIKALVLNGSDECPHSWEEKSRETGPHGSELNEVYCRLCLKVVIPSIHNGS